MEICSALNQKSLFFILMTQAVPSSPAADANAVLQRGLWPTRSPEERLSKQSEAALQSFGKPILHFSFPIEDTFQNTAQKKREDIDLLSFIGVT